MIEISQHAYDRASERYSLNRKSFTRLAEKAFEQGKMTTFSMADYNKPFIVIKDNTKS